MALEDKIDELIEALNANTAALKAGGGGKASAPAKSEAPKKQEPKGPDLDTLVKKFGAFLNAKGDDAKPVVKAINAHFEVKKISDLDSDRYQEALDILGQYENDEDPLGVGGGSLV